MRQLKIGNVTADCPVVLAPMAGVTDLPFRLLCREMGVGLLSMEMVSAKALQYKNKNTAAIRRSWDRSLRRSRTGRLISWTSTWAARCRR